VLPNANAETVGYGLYSYAILTSKSERSSAFLEQIFTNVRNIQQTAAKRNQVNIFYIPIQSSKAMSAKSLLASTTHLKKPEKDITKTFMDEFYDLTLAQQILDHLCSRPPDFMQTMCGGDLSGGPYILTYPMPASEYDPIPPPYLFFDLTNLNAKTFGEIIAAFKERVRKDDVSDNLRLISLRLRVLSVVLTAADWINPVGAAVADIIHSEKPSAAKSPGIP
jgi:hypothetical protein